MSLWPSVYFVHNLFLFCSFTGSDCQITIENNINWWWKTKVPTLLIKGIMATGELTKMSNIFEVFAHARIQGQLVSTSLPFCNITPPPIQSASLCADCQTFFLFKFISSSHCIPNPCNVSDCVYCEPIPTPLSIALVSWSNSFLLTSSRLIPFAKLQWCEATWRKGRTLKN